MKFSKLEIGQPFEYRGIRYTKTGPLQAEVSATGEERMILRAAAVHPIEPGNQNGIAEAPLFHEQTDQIRKTIDDYHQSVLTLLEETGNSHRKAEFENYHCIIAGMLQQMSREC